MRLATAMTAARPRHLRARRSSLAHELVAHLLSYTERSTGPRHQPRTSQPSDRAGLSRDSVQSDGSPTDPSQPGPDAAAAVQLFADRAEAVVPDFYVSPGNRPTSKPSADRLDGLPLAIELAALQVPLFTVHDLLARLRREAGRHRAMAHALHRPVMRASMRRWTGASSSARQTSRHSGCAARSSAAASTWPQPKQVCTDAEFGVDEVLPGLSGLLVEVDPASRTQRRQRCDSGCWTRSATTACADWTTPEPQRRRTRRMGRELRPPGPRELVRTRPAKLARPVRGRAGQHPGRPRALRWHEPGSTQRAGDRRLRCGSTGCRPVTSTRAPSGSNRALASTYATPSPQRNRGLWIAASVRDLAASARRGRGDGAPLPHRGRQRTTTWRRPPTPRTSSACRRSSVAICCWPRSYLLEALCGLSTAAGLRRCAIGDGEDPSGDDATPTAITSTRRLSSSSRSRIDCEAGRRPVGRGYAMQTIASCNFLRDDSQRPGCAAAWLGPGHTVVPPGARADSQ